MVSDLKLLPPIDARDVPLIRCLGLNYSDHAKEANMPAPKEPVLFVKPRTSLCGSYPQKIVIPKFVQDGTSDYEAELTFIISRDGRDIPEKDAMSYVLGFTCGNDVSARTQQFKNSQWSFSKGFDSAAPIGPTLVSPEALGDPHKLKIQAIHNGSVVQDSNTKEMIFGIQKTVSFLSQGTTLERGTVIMTGTPPGIGAMRDPKVVLRHGDDMRVYIAGIGKWNPFTANLDPMFRINQILTVPSCRDIGQHYRVRVIDEIIDTNKLQTCPNYYRSAKQTTQESFPALW